MSDTDPDASSVPSDTAISTALRDAVKRVFASDQLENLTVKRVRATVTRDLALPDELFKSNEEWKAKSKEIIEEESAAQYTQREANDSIAATKERVSPQKSRNPTSRARDASKGEGKGHESGRGTKGTKRSSPDAESQTRKRRKRSSASDESSPLSDLPSVGDSEVEPSESKPKGNGRASSTAKGTKKAIAISPSDEDADDGGKSKPKTSEEADEDAGSESAMSVLLDDQSAPKKKRRRSSAKSSNKSQRAKDTKPKKDADLEPQESEIKRLQSWLLKCGIRKLWHRELAPYDTPKAKIHHLKRLLKEVGMDGRYSADKASKIKEERELQAEVEAVQSFPKQWGNSSDEDNGASAEKPRRRLARGLKELDFLGEDDGEEGSD
ncbi:MAG: hypothetical protein M1837_001226 [Sclerophora amabilis]|nr:MAG: hypothetical protein M1837_001226 [Sclerophora amabilis]